jgi:hypothetical protein
MMMPVFHRVVWQLDQSFGADYRSRIVKRVKITLPSALPDKQPGDSFPFDGEPYTVTIEVYSIGPQGGAKHYGIFAFSPEEWEEITRAVADARARAQSMLAS